MTIRIESRGGKLVVDIRTRGPEGPLRERRNAPDGIRSKSGAQRWAEARQAVLAQEGKPEPKKLAPTLAEFGPRWMKEYAHANGNKPSTLAAKDTILRLHLYPTLGAVRLDSIESPDIQRLKLHLAGKAAKTRACVLSVLATLLRTAERWNEITKAPQVDIPKWQDPEMEFYDFTEWEALVDGARKAGPNVLAAVLLGGDAGLRRGELIALRHTDIRLGSVHVVRNDWMGVEGTPKGGNGRTVPLTARLKEAVGAIRSLRGHRLLWQANGHAVHVETLKSWMETACRRAGLPESRNLHKLRHTFGSHLAMRGAPARVIQELMGHADLKTTMRYMHLARGSKEEAISLLGRGAGGEQRSAESRP